MLILPYASFLAISLLGFPIGCRLYILSVKDLDEVMSGTA